VPTPTPTPTPTPPAPTPTPAPPPAPTPTPPPPAPTPPPPPSAATPEFLVNSATAGLQSEVNLARLSDGNLIAVWRTAANAGDIQAQILDPNGNRIGGEFVIVSNAARQRNPAVGAIPGGGFAVVWSEPDNNASGLRVRGQFFANTGTRVGTEFSWGTETILFPAYARVAEQLSVVGLSNGGIAVTSETADRGSFHQATTEVRTRVVSASGVVAPDILLASGGPPSASVPEANAFVDSALLTSGNYVVVYSYTGTAPMTFFRIFNASGQPVTDQRVIGGGGPTAIVSTETSVTALPDGGFMTARSQAGIIILRRYDASGVQVGTDTSVGSGGASSLSLLSDGRIVLTYHGPEAAGGSGFDIYAATFALGGPISTIALINQATAGIQLAPRVQATSAGRFIILWNDASGVGGDSDGGIKAIVLVGG
jgi:hypothetical protein